MMKLTCNACAHEWDYNGEKEPPAMVSCPNCLSRVKLPKNEDEAMEE